MTVQNYYTKDSTALAIGYLAKNRMSYYSPKTILDLCAGEGNFARGLLAHSADYRPNILFVEPDQNALPQLIKRRKLGHDQVFAMTGEEFALTHAKPEMVDLAICNPPFAQRCGRTELNELAKDLHLSHIHYFESYFLHLAAEISFEHMAFILPDSYARRLEAQETMMHLACRGWKLDHLYALPINGFEGATVNTTLWWFQKRYNFEDEETFDASWVEPALEIAGQSSAGSLIRCLEIGELSGPHGPVTGYVYESMSRKEMSDSIYPSYFTQEERKMEPKAEALWHPKPKPMGTLWKRMGLMYELAETGWQPANQKGWCNGEPVEADFDLARTAFSFLKLGAYHTASTLVADLDLKLLQEQFSEIANASFLSLLPQKQHDDPLGKDLANLGMLELPTEIDLPTPESVQRVGQVLYREDAMIFSQRCQLYLEHYKVLPPTFVSSLKKELEAHTIPLTQCTLRSPWIPKRLIAVFCDMKLDASEFYIWGCGLPNSLANYLNGGNKGRIDATDEAVFETENLKFGQFVNHWEGKEMHELRYQIHAHFHMAHASREIRRLNSKIQLPTRPAHPWQKDDLPFALSGQAFYCWDVGLGKTTGGIMAAMNHPGPAMIIVPKSVLAKWYREALVCYPNAQVQVIGYKPKPGGNSFPVDKTPVAKRFGEVFFDPNVDIILTTHQVFSRIGISDVERALADEDAAIANIGHSSAKTKKRAREMMIQRAAQLNFQHRETEFTWSDLPLASMMLIVDEAHISRSLYPMPTKGWSEALIMSGSSSVSKTARDMLIKCDLLHQAGGKTLALTATPVTNSVAEVFSMLRIYAPDVLTQRGIVNVREFMDQYCQLASRTAISPSGNIRHGKAIVGFTNREDLQVMFGDAMKTRTAASVNLPLPKVKEEIMPVEPTWAMEMFIEDQRDGIQKAIQNEEPGYILKLMSEIHKLATFPPIQGIADNPKAEKVVAQIMKHYGQGGQIVFIDLIEAQEGYRDLLIQHGVPPEEIALINQDAASTAQKRLTIQDRFNAGELTVVIGGAAASVGMDLQKNTVAIHHVALPWEGQTVHQRNGRGVRQGNEQDMVRIYYYVLKGSTDAYRLATINTKNTWWSSLRSTQTDDVHESVFADPIPDEMIAGLANDPDEALALLKKQRKDREWGAELKIFKSALKGMRSYLDNTDASLQILRSLEGKLRALNHFPKSLIDELVRRVSIIRKFRAKDPFNQCFRTGYDWRGMFIIEDTEPLVFKNTDLSKILQISVHPFIEKGVRTFLGGPNLPASVTPEPVVEEIPDFLAPELMALEPETETTNIKTSKQAGLPDPVAVTYSDKKPQKPSEPKADMDKSVQERKPRATKDQVKQASTTKDKSQVAEAPQTRLKDTEHTPALSSRGKAKPPGKRRQEIAVQMSLFDVVAPKVFREPVKAEIRTAVQLCLFD